jgi:hypothetical protein
MDKTDIKLKRTAKGKRPHYLSDPTSDLEDIENYVPSDQEQAVRQERRAEYLQRIFRSVQEEIDELGQPAD